MVGRVTERGAHLLVPVVGNAGEPWIKRSAQALDQIRQRITEIAVLAPAEAMARHHHMAAEMFFVRIERGDFGAFLRRKQAGHDSAALGVELGDERVPVLRGDTGFGGASGAFGVEGMDGHERLL